MTIPPRVHFVWIGTQLPWAYVFAVLSAAARSDMDEVILHHTDALADSAELLALKAAAGVRLNRIDPIALLARAGDALGIGGALTAIYRRLERPVMRADVLRAAILYLQGGVYLDLDTVTTRSLRPLLETPHFVGSELIVWPRAVRESWSPFVWVRHLGLDLMRKACRSMPDGWRAFRRVEGLYVRGLNNAVMGAESKSALFADYLTAMPRVPLDPPPRTYAFGPDLLQEVVAHYPGNDLTIEEPRVFYPLPPEISTHWFRIRPRVRLDAALSAETRVVHWYGSVRTRSPVAQIDPAFVRNHRDHQLYSALVCASIDNLP